MNYLAIIRKHLKCIDEAYEGITVEGTRKKAGGMILEATMRYEGMEMPSLAVSEPVLGDLVIGEVVSVPEVPKPVELKERASVTIWNGNPVLTPVSDHESETVGVVAEVIGDVSPCALPEPVEMIGGWPAKPEIEVCGLAPNRRHIRGKLGDGRVVTVERSFARQWVNGEKVRCRLIRAGAAPLYRITLGTK